MVNLKIIMVLALAGISSEAEAHCYSVWKYPWPQRCGTGHKQVERVTVDIVLPPAPLTEEDRRDQAIERLKEMLNHVGY